MAGFLSFREWLKSWFKLCSSQGERKGELKAYSALMLRNNWLHQNDIVFNDSSPNPSLVIDRVARQGAGAS
uniref:Uncharacterized protein n=1 Tax=Nelumbo nucifera TaxID=4432 RepID=A0A822YDH8_NELNU|nr:TPA_asm: hypothetical protein HUJ06_009481 [Nelumbo nucifera]